MTLAKRIKSTRLAANLSQEKLAKAISDLDSNQTITRTAVAQWETGITKEITAANLLKTAKVLNINPEWLRFGTGVRTRDDMQRANLLLNCAVKAIPLLNQQQAVNYLDYMKRSTSHSFLIGIDSDLAAVTGQHTFAMKLDDQSMLPEFVLEDIVLIDPDIKPQPGDIVLALIKNDGLLLRKYHPLDSHTDHFVSFELIPLNENWPVITITDKTSGQIIGTLVEHRCRRRL